MTSADNWRHEVVLEKIVAATPWTEVRPVCHAGGVLVFIDIAAAQFAEGDRA